MLILQTAQAAIQISSSHITSGYGAPETLTNGQVIN